MSRDSKINLFWLLFCLPMSAGMIAHFDVETFLVAVIGTLVVSVLVHFMVCQMTGDMNFVEKWRVMRELRKRR